MVDTVSVQRVAVPSGGLPPQQVALRNRMLGAGSQWRDFTLDEIEQTVPQRLAQVIAQGPERVAVQDPVRSYTYAELDRAANQIGRALLREAGDGNEPVPYLFHVDARRTPAVHGILRAGKPILGLDAADAAERLSYLIEFTGARAVITGNETVELAQALVPKGCRVVDVDEALAEEPAEPLLVPGSPDDVAALIHTSGSTGRPKAALNRHRALLGRLRGHIVYDLTAPGDRISTIGLRSGDIVYPLTGATYLPFPVREKGLHAFAAWLADQKVTRISAVASGFRQFLDILQPEQSFPLVRSVRITSEPIYGSDLSAIARTFPNAILQHALTVSEGGWLTIYYVDPKTFPNDEPIPIGYAVADKELWLEDEAGHRVPDGEVGEIVVSGRTIAHGYWNQPELTAERFRTDAADARRFIYATGDLGRYQPDGALLHLGRKDLQLKIRGHRVELGEVEAALRTLPGVRDVAVRDWTDGSGERYLTAYVVPESSTTRINRLRRDAAVCLPDYMAPRTYVQMDSLPRLWNGKVDRQALPEPGRVRPQLSTPFVPPATPLEARLSAIWSEVLELDSVGVEDRFTDLGGYSLAAVRLLAALDEFTDRNLPYSVLLEAGTVRDLAKVLEDAGWVQSWRTLVQVQPGDGRPPLFVVPAAASTSLSLAPFAKELGAGQGVYGFDPVGLDGACAPLESVEEIAALYVDEMRRLQPQGPYLLGGRCFGALVALDMARQLEEKGEEAPLVAVLDSGAVGFPTFEAGLYRRRMRWQMRRREHSPWQIFGQSIAYRSRRVKKKLGVGAYRFEDPTDRVRSAHREASRRYRAKPVHGRLVVFMSQEYAALGYNREWRRFAAGEYAEDICDRWTHVGFLNDPAILRHVCERMREELSPFAQCTEGQMRSPNG